MLATVVTVPVLLRDAMEVLAGLRRGRGGALPVGGISGGVEGWSVRAEQVHEILEATKRSSIGERDWPAPVVGAFVIGLARSGRSSFRKVLRCVREGLPWLRPPNGRPRVAGTGSDVSSAGREARRRGPIRLGGLTRKWDARTVGRAQGPLPR